MFIAKYSSSKRLIWQKLIVNTIKGKDTKATLAIDPVHSSVYFTIDADRGPAFKTGTLFKYNATGKKVCSSTIFR